MVNEPISEVEPTTPEVEPEKSELPQLVLPLADMTPEERFRATARLIFLAPDVPPVQPRQRRSELRWDKAPCNSSHIHSVRWHLSEAGKPSDQ